MTDEQLKMPGKVYCIHHQEMVEVIDFNSFSQGAPNDNVRVKFSNGQTQTIPRVYLTVDPKHIPIELAMDNML